MARKERLDFGEDMLNVLNVRHNIGVATYVRIFGSLLIGLAAGIQGVTGWIGFLYYLAAQGVVTALLWSKAQGQTDLYFPSRSILLYGEVFGSTTLLTFILFWTLAHNLIHLF